MALSATIVWEVQTGGAATNGGGFKPGASGTDWSQQASAQYSVTDAVTAGTTTITSATANFGTDVVGNTLYIQGGTGSITAGWYEITARNSATSITVDRSTGLTTGTGATLKIGGALDSLGTAGAAHVAGNTIYQKSGAYTVSSTSSNVSGGKISLTAGSSGAMTRLIGYGSTRGDGGTRPVNTSSAASTPVVTLANNVHVENIEVNGNSTSATCFLNTASGIVVSCVGKNATSRNFSQSSATRARAIACYSYTSGSTGFESGQLLNCVDVGSGYGFGLWTAGDTATNCFAINNTTAGFDFQAASAAYNCTAYNATRGFYQDGTLAVPIPVVNCLAVNCTTKGFDASAATGGMELWNCAGYNNSGGNVSTNITSNTGFITLSAAPFVATGSSNYALNSTAGGGAALKQVGYPTSFNGLSTSNYIDIGAAQAVASGGIIRTGMDGGF